MSLRGWGRGAALELDHRTEAFTGPVLAVVGVEPEGVSQALPDNVFALGSHDVVDDLVLPVVLGRGDISELCELDGLSRVDTVHSDMVAPQPPR